MATQTAGSIGIGVVLDGSDLGTQMAKAVQSSLSEVLKSVQSQVGKISAAINSVDASRVTAVSRAAGDAASAASSLAGAEGQVATASDKMARSARDAADATDKVTKSQKESSEQSEKAKRSFEGAGSGMDDYAKKAGAAAIGVAGVATALDTAFAAIEQKDLGNKLAAQLNLDPGEQAKAGKIAGDLYANAYGDSFGAVNDALGAVTSSLGNMTDTSESDLSAMTRNALDLAKTFDVDVSESTMAASLLMRNGFAKDGKEAFDQITAAMQEVPTSMRGELFPVLNEYGTNLQSVGFSGAEAIALVTNAAFDGAIGIDKAGDAIKEFGIRATDIGDKNAQQALKDLGLDAVQMSNDLLKGGDTAQAAFQKIVKGLLDMGPGAEQAARAVDLFGTPLEDLDKAKIPGFLIGLNKAGLGMGDVAGRADEMGRKLNSGPGAALDKVKRQIETTLIDTLGKAATYLTDHQGLLKGLAIGIGAVATAYVALRTASALSSVAMGINTAVTGTNTAALATNKIALGASAIASGVMRAAQIAGTIATVAATVATTAATAATTAFGVALSIATAPITLIVVGIAALIAGLVLFFTKTELGRSIWEGFVNFLVSSWEAIKGAFSAAWEFIQPILAAIWDFVGNVLVGAFNGLVSVVTTVFDAIGAVISAVWNTVILPVFNAWQTVVFGILVPLFMFFWNQVVVPVFTGIGNVISTVWNTVIKVAFDALKVGIDILAGAFSWLWNQVVVPAMNGIGGAISWVWDNVIRPAWDGIKTGITALGDAMGWLWNNAIKPAWDGIGAAISWVWENVIRPAWDAMKTGLGAIGDFFRTTVDGIKNVWDGLRNILAKPINFMINTVYNDGIRKAWNKVAEFIPGLVEAPAMSPIPEFATGGALRGKGSGTSDDILMWGSNGEHMVTADEVRKAGGQNIIYTIRDMIKRGIPFSWDNGQLVNELGRTNMDSYGAAVHQAGYGNVDPQGMFDVLKGLPKRATGGPITDKDIEPWMRQLAAGHEFAKAQHGKPYQWAGPTGPGSSFDCSGFMGSIAAAITGGDPWRRYWATGSFGRGQGAGGPQGFVPGLDAGFSIGVTDDPGGPGGGHTAGTLGAIPLLGISRAVNVESGGALGDVHYGGGTQPESFMGQYHLPIGANGFFQPGDGSGRSGPSPDEQKSYLNKVIRETFDTILDPIKGGIAGAIGSPPPEWLGIPGKMLDRGADVAAEFLAGAVDNLGGVLGGAWSKAKELGGNVLDRLNPFDQGGIANGVGMMPKNVIAPERVLSPQQTVLFEDLIRALQLIAGGTASAPIMPTGGTFLDGEGGKIISETGELLSDTRAALDRTATSQATEDAKRHEETMAVLGNLANQLTEKVLVPSFTKAIEAGLSSSTADSALQGLGNSVGQTAGQLIVQAMRAATAGGMAFADGGTLPGYTPGRDVHQFYSPTGGRLALSGGEAIMRPEWTRAVGGPAAVAAMNRRARNGMGFANGGVLGFADGGTVGSDLFGGGTGMNVLVNAVMKVAGIELKMLDTLTGVAKDVRAFKGDAVNAFEANGDLISDTASLIERTETSKATEEAERERMMREIIGGVIKFLIVSILIPAISAVLSSLITLATTAIGTAIAGPVGTVIGAAVGAALGGLATIVTGALGAALAGGVDAVFDEGGVANGIGIMPKRTIQPERVLSPRQTSAFERLVSALEGGAGAGGKSIQVHAPISVQGGERAGERVRDGLLTLLN